MKHLELSRLRATLNSLRNAHNQHHFSLKAVGDEVEDLREVKQRLSQELEVRSPRGVGREKAYQVDGEKQDKNETQEALKTTLETLTKEHQRTYHYQQSMLFLRNRTQKLKSKDQQEINELEYMISRVTKLVLRRTHGLEEVKKRNKVNSEALAELRSVNDAKLVLWRKRFEQLYDEKNEAEAVEKSREARKVRHDKIYSHVNGDLDAEGEDQLRSENVKTKLKHFKLEKDYKRKEVDFSAYEAGLKKFIAITGMKDPGNIVEHYQEQENLQKLLQSQLGDSDQMLKTLKVESEALKQKVREEHQFTDGINTLSGMMVSSQNSNLTETAVWGRSMEKRKQAEHKERELSLILKQVATARKEAYHYMVETQKMKLAVRNVLHKLDCILLTEEELGLVKLSKESSCSASRASLKDGQGMAKTSEQSQPQQNSFEEQLFILKLKLQQLFRGTEPRKSAVAACTDET